jgi:hypothetical protein
MELSGAAGGSTGRKHGTLFWWDQRQLLTRGEPFAGPLAMCARIAITRQVLAPECSHLLRPGLVFPISSDSPPIVRHCFCQLYRHYTRVDREPEPITVTRSITMNPTSSPRSKFINTSTSEFLSVHETRIHPHLPVHCNDHIRVNRSHHIRLCRHHLILVQHRLLSQVHYRHHIRLDRCSYLRVS